MRLPEFAGSFFMLASKSETGTCGEQRACFNRRKLNCITKTVL
jgi:hypothetical protein